MADFILSRIPETEKALFEKEPDFLGNEVETLNKKLAELTADELAQVAGGYTTVKDEDKLIGADDHENEGRTERTQE